MGVLLRRVGALPVVLPHRSDTRGITVHVRVASRCLVSRVRDFVREWPCAHYGWSANAHSPRGTIRTIRHLQLNTVCREDFRPVHTLCDTLGTEAPWLHP